MMNNKNPMMKSMFMVNEKHKDASIIIPCKNEGIFLENTIKSIMEAKNNVSFEIIVVDDGSTDGCTKFLKIDNIKYKDVKLISSSKLGVGKAKNLGAKYANGEIIFFCDAHILVSDYWLDRLIISIKTNNAHAISCGIRDMNNVGIGFGESWDSQLSLIWLKKSKSTISEIPIAPGAMFGIYKHVFKLINGFDKNMILWGKEDEEISLRLWLFGYKIIVDNTVEIKHLFKTKNTCGITQENLVYNHLCLIYSHFNFQNISKAISLISHRPNFEEAYSKIIFNKKIMEQRKRYFDIRKYNENDFFRKFNINF